MTSLLSLATLALLTLYIGLAVAGALLLRRSGWRVAGAALLLLAALATAAQLALSTLSPGIGEPFIRIDLGALLTQTGAGILVVGLVAALLLRGLPRLWRWLTGRRRPGPILAGLLTLLPVAAGLAMYGMVQAGTPARERERDPLRREIALPEGFSWSVFARSTEWDNPTVMAFGPGGRLFVGDINGDLWVVEPAAGAEPRISKLDGGYQLLLGLAWRDGELFVASQGRIEALRDANGDGRFEARRTVVEGLPAMVLRPHSNNSISFGPDGRLYFGVGSTSDGELEQDPLAAAILSVNPDGSDLRVFARGFGNPFALAFNSQGELFGGDNSIRDQPDEFNHIVAGEHYGFPYYFGDPPEGGATGALATFPPHSAPTGVSFYSGAQFPAEYRDNAFLTLWARGELQRIEVARTTAGGYLSRVTTFGSGFLYPIGAVTGPDGALYVADFGTSAIYRISYEG
jgi:glucose/arabinose dehydrogenase